jgi:hypothetical protein
MTKEEKKLVVCDALINTNSNKEHKFITNNFCAPVFIVSTFSAGNFIKDEDIIFDDFNDESIRNGTLTFISYNGEYFAVTSNHVIDCLKNKQQKWKKMAKEKYSFEGKDMQGFGLYTYIGNTHFHFNYEFTSVEEDYNPVDVAIARVNLTSIKRLGREPLELTKKDNFPETGIASGYPEEQRVIKKGNILNKFAAKFVTCTATLQESDKKVTLNDTIENHNNVDNPSGMSGGPIIWSDAEEYGLAGIVDYGSDIQPKDGKVKCDNGILIFGIKITPDIFDGWLQYIPPLKELNDESKELYISRK